MASAVGLFLIFESTTLEAADAIVPGAIATKLHPALSATAFVVLTVVLLSFINYRGVHGSLTFTLVITAIAFATIIILLFGAEFWKPGKVRPTASWASWRLPSSASATISESPAPARRRGMPVAGPCAPDRYDVGADHAADRGDDHLVCRHRLVDWVTLGSSADPLYNAALNTGKQWLIVTLFIGTVLSSLASANGCINDALRAWFAMGRDHFVPRFFGAVYPNYQTPHRAILFLNPPEQDPGASGLGDQHGGGQVPWPSGLRRSWRSSR